MSGGAASLHRVLVVGASGVVGGAAVRALLARGVAVRGLRRWSSRLEGLGAAASRVEWSVGELGRPEELRRALVGCSEVIWAAEPRGFGGRREGVGLAEELGALRGALELMRDEHIRRVVFASSLLTVGPGGEVAPPPTGEGAAAEVGRRHYWRELEARRYAGLGLPLVVVNLGLVVGEGAAADRGGGVMRRLRYPSLSRSGELGWTEVDAAGEGLVRALERGEPGARYGVITGRRRLVARLPPAWVALRRRLPGFDPLAEALLAHPGWDAPPSP